jgi:glucose-6-phosphate-specific signal transduction histidine kinase
MKTKAAYWTCQILGWASYCSLGMWIAAQTVGWTTELTAGYALYFLYSIALTHLLRRYVNRRGWVDTLRYFPLMFAAWITGLIQAALVIAINWAIAGKTSVFLKPGAIAPKVIGISFVTVGWMVVYLVITSGRRNREKQLALREAELRGLEAQINPHFLFNSLNSIRGLVVENPPLAQDLITRLANILRYNLHRDAGHTVPLDSELEAAADYLALESARYEDRLRVRFDVDPATRSIAVPPMLVQTLVENGIKHGIATLPAGGELLVGAALEDGTLVLKVENSGQLAENETGRPRLGLRNIRERLRILYAGRAGLELASRDGRVIATVRIPTRP